jgi:signal transduction histidine kinase
MKEELGEDIVTPASPTHVLLVEDEDGFRDLMSGFLRSLGCEVTECCDGETGLMEQRKRPADIVLTDIRMRGVDGMEVLRRVRESWPHTEVILITGYATVEAAIEALRHGAYDLLLKPVRLEQIETVIRHCEERIRYARENLELRRVIDRLRELNTRKEKFVALANHELRTPTTVASGILNLLKRRTDDLPPDVADLIGRADQALGRMREIVNDLSDLATARSDGQWLKRASWSMEDLFDDLGCLCAEYAELRSVDVHVKGNPDPDRRVFVDRSKLARAVGALVQNAVKSTPDGGRVDACLSLKSGEIEFSVADNGVGIPPEEAKRIFDLFYKVGDALAHHTSGHEFGGGGLGVGLPLARTIARAHGGDVRYSPRPEGGSVFTLAVPTGNT